MENLSTIPKEEDGENIPFNHSILCERVSSNRSNRALCLAIPVKSATSLISLTLPRINHINEQHRSDMQNTNRNNVKIANIIRHKKI